MDHSRPWLFASSRCELTSPVRLGVDGDREADACATAGPIRDPCIAAVRLGDSGNEREAEAQPSTRGRHEGAKRIGAAIGLYAGTLVVDLDGDDVAATLDPNGDRATAMRLCVV